MAALPIYLSGLPLASHDAVILAYKPLITKLKRVENTPIYHQKAKSPLPEIDDAYSNRGVRH